MSSWPKLRLSYFAWQLFPICFRIFETRRKAMCKISKCPNRSHKLQNHELWQNWNPRFSVKSRSRKRAFNSDCRLTLPCQWLPSERTSFFSWSSIFVSHNPRFPWNYIEDHFGQSGPAFFTSKLARFHRYLPILERQMATVDQRSSEITHPKNGNNYQSPFWNKELGQCTFFGSSVSKR